MVTRRQVEWQDQSVLNTAVAIGSQIGLDLTDQMAELDKGGATITRIIGSLVVRPDTTQQRDFVFAGIVLVNEDAVAGALFPDPSVDGDQPGWMWKGFDTVMVSNTGDSSQFSRLHFDIRSQRKMRHTDDLILVVDNSSVSAGGIVFDFLTRTLVKHR